MAALVQASAANCALAWEPVSVWALSKAYVGIGCRMWRR